MANIPQTEIRGMQKLHRLANYLSVAQIYLRDNVLLDNPLTPQNIKPRLLGHWGTCPGISFVYAQINRLITKNQTPFLYVVGPGHGFPAIQSNLFLEGTLSKYYPEKIPYNADGLREICEKFSAPYGYPSHANPAAPGTILEGGELGYSLSVSYGSVLDNPELITVCLVGDGESETGPLATAWHLNKLVSPKENGAVLPIVHLNGYKISGPTIYGRMSDSELTKLFEGYGYEPMIVDQDKSEIFEKMAKTMDKAVKKIRQIQTKSRKGQKILRPKFPVIILRTHKGWTGVQYDGLTKLEGNCKSHQVILGDVQNNSKHLKMLEGWLASYRVEELFEIKNGKLKLDAEIENILPKNRLRLGDQQLAYGGEIVRELKLPPVHDLAIKIGRKRGQTKTSSMHKIGEYMREIMKKNPQNYRLFSPDETYSNQLQAVFETTTRTWQWPIENWDEDLAPTGRVMEMLSEHSLFGLLHGYTVTGRHGAFTSYEAFCQIVASMADQYCKFIKASEEVKFRKPLPAMNILLTSLLERQDHNGFSHQNPSFLSSMLEKDGQIISAYLPPDANCALETMREINESRNQLNIVIAGKKDLPIWLTPTEAHKQTKQGILTWDFASDQNPDIVIAASGDYVVQESLAAIQIAKQLLPHLKIRFVCVSELTALGVGDTNNPHDSKFLDQFFTKDKPVIFNFHGYPQTIKKLLFDYTGANRITVHGYEEQGSTTTPFDMEIRNGTSRYHIAKEIAIRTTENQATSEADAELAQKTIVKKILEHKSYILDNGDDPLEISEWQWQK